MGYQTLLYFAMFFGAVVALAFDRAEDFQDVTNLALLFGMSVYMTDRLK